MRESKTWRLVWKVWYRPIGKSARLHPNQLAQHMKTDFESETYTQHLISGIGIEIVLDKVDYLKDFIWNSM